MNSAVGYYRVWDVQDSQDMRPFQSFATWMEMVSLSSAVMTKGRSVRVNFVQSLRWANISDSCSSWNLSWNTDFTFRLASSEENHILNQQAVILQKTKTKQKQKTKNPIRNMYISRWKH